MNICFLPCFLPSLFLCLFTLNFVWVQAVLASTKVRWSSSSHSSSSSHFLIMTRSAWIFTRSCEEKKYLLHFFSMHILGWETCGVNLYLPLGVLYLWEVWRHFIVFLYETRGICDWNYPHSFRQQEFQRSSFCKCGFLLFEKQCARRQLYFLTVLMLTTVTVLYFMFAVRYSRDTAVPGCCNQHLPWEEYLKGICHVVHMIYSYIYIFNIIRCMYVWMYECMYVCTYVCMYTCM